MITADVARGAVAAAAVAAVATHASVVLVVALATAISIGDGFFAPASFAYMSEIVPADRLLGANSAVSVSQQVGLIVGPLIGGFLVGYSGAPYAFAFDALSFLASALFVFLIRPGRPPAPTDVPATDVPATDVPATDVPATDVPESGVAGIRGVIDEIRGGLAYVGVQRWLLISFAVGALANAVFAGNLDVTVPFIVSPGGVHGAQHLGGFYTLEGVGAVIGAIVLARLTITRPGPLMFRMLGLMAASLGMVGLFGGGIGTYVAALAYGVGMHFFNTIFSTALQDKVPDALMSRVSSVAFLGFAGLMPVGTLLMGPLVSAFGAERTVAGTGLVICAVCLVTAFVRAIRDLRTPGADPEEAS
jgi:predicted MFS family arabinose efflux permease